ncbi:RNA polymerase I transcription factor subunit Rrn11 [Schizosaccharomyces japonicus yFS275]|uniref:RNA polymerase I transcription factor subunit Rrn11 n=1 Tax=Schizosaccharomyces japonicus (strain yFS275 / FY16936) TaxID=402676 RepID=B6JWB8_SCHJY|nr:RNA polymerase I transcription factor subunit Rrn11 [Schizosaccharomyces japonicus yFS275]EEB05669.1 RNA polymerase I transcription factor subunit Rrn11 [Schizosaccharomyces japonicus yFS275]
MFSPVTKRKVQTGFKRLESVQKELPALPAPPKSLRLQHIENLRTLLHLCLLRADYPRAFRAFSLLLRCRSVDIRLLWKIGLELLNELEPSKAREYLQRLIARFPAIPGRHKTSIDAHSFFPALVLLQIKMGEYGQAISSLDEYLLSAPFNENQPLYVYSAMLSLEMANREENHYERGRWLEKARQQFAKADEMRLLETPNAFTDMIG